MARTNAPKASSQKQGKQTQLTDFLKVVTANGDSKPQEASQKFSNRKRGAISEEEPQAKKRRVDHSLGLEDLDFAGRSADLDDWPQPSSMGPDDQYYDREASQAEAIQASTAHATGGSSQGSSTVFDEPTDFLRSQETGLTSIYTGEFKAPDSPKIGPSSLDFVVDASLVSDPTPHLIDGGYETIGIGAYQAMVSVKILPQHSSMYFKDVIPQVDKSDASVAKFRRDAQDYPVVRENTQIRSSDGKVLLTFIERAMYQGFRPDEEENLASQTLTSIRELNKVYRPPPPSAKDSRMQRQQRRIQANKHAYFGRYMFCYWIGAGCNFLGPSLSTESRPKAKKAMTKVAEYMQATKWEHTQVSRWIAALDPGIHKELHDCYQALGEEKMKHLYQGPEACHSGLALLINRTEDPHKDQNDACDNWTTTNCWGVFTGGCVAYPELGVKVAQKPGDLNLCRAAILTHFVEEVDTGERFCHVRFTKKDILRPTGKVYVDLGIPCPVEGCSEHRPSESSMRKHLYGPTDKDVKAKRSPKYHWLPLNEAKNLLKGAMAAANRERK